MEGSVITKKSRHQSAPRPSRAQLDAAKREVADWFHSKGYEPFRFQRQAWNAYLSGQNGLIHASTGTGKTFAAWMGPLIEILAQRSTRKITSPLPLQVLWITPLRALANDTFDSLALPVLDMDLPMTVDIRTGDTTSSARARQKKRLPTALVTTPESLTVMLSQEDAQAKLRDLRLVVVDEWHELMGSKRGTQTELALARLRHWNPRVQTWGLSATLGNTESAMDVLLGQHRDTPSGQALISGRRRKSMAIETMIPSKIERFPWAGHLGTRLVDDVAKRVDEAKTSLVFTNTRSQTEAWYQRLLEIRPDWAGLIAVHHGSIDRDTRGWVEQQLRVGQLKCVVCTSSLDLGVDFSPVEQVFQVGSPKGVSRLMQRAGRSGHSPDRRSRVICVPTNTLELIEFAAAKDAIERNELESRISPNAPLDVLIQHLVTMACGGGFHAERLLEEVRQTHAYRDLTTSDWEWALKFITTGGDALKAYPEYRRVVPDDDGSLMIGDRKIARNHRLSIGTIVGDANITVQFVKGPRLGTVEEAFIAKVSPGEAFYFAGRLVELVRVQDSKVWVRRAKNAEKPVIPRWMGGRMPLSTELSHAVRRKLHQAAEGVFDSEEMQAIQPVLELQQAWSAIPRQQQLLIESTKSREGYHLFFFPFAGRLVHEGLAALMAYRLARLQPITFSMAVNDYGFELLSPTEIPIQEGLQSDLFRSERIQDDIMACLNSVEMAKRQFREVAHIAGLVFQGYPGSRKSARQLQASTGLLFDVFSNYDQDNLLLKQAKAEVLERNLERQRLLDTLEAIRESEIIIRPTKRFTPLAFPLVVDRLRERLSSEKLSDRVRRMQQQLENAAEKP